MVFVWDVSVNSTINSLDNWLDGISEGNREVDLSSDEVHSHSISSGDEELANSTFRIPLLVVIK